MFQKGQSGNASGRPKGIKNKFTVAELQKAFQKASKKHNNVSFLDHITDLAYTDNQVAIALLKKLLPDLKSIDMTAVFSDVGNDEELAQKIREKLIERLK